MPAMYHALISGELGYYNTHVWNWDHKVVFILLLN